MHYPNQPTQHPNPASYISDLNVNQLESLATELSAYFTMLKLSPYSRQWYPTDFGVNL